MLSLCGLTLIIWALTFTLFLIVQRQRRQRWSELASAASLTFESEGIIPTNRIFGVYRGRPILIDSTVIQINLRWHKFKRIRLPLSDTYDLTIKVTRQGFIGRIARKLQPSKQLPNIKHLPGRYFVEGNSSRFATALLGRATQFERLLQDRKVYQIGIENDELHFIKTPEFLPSKDKFLELIDSLVDSAEFYEQTFENIAPEQYSQGKRLPFLSQFLAKSKAQDLKYSEEIKRSGSQSCVVIFLLFSSMLVLGYCFLFWLASLLA
jgi:hypothetical protein